jgi:uncharacterized repeat protein (TIGR01451 family)
MRNRWIVPSAVALLSLVLVLLWGQMASQALIPPGDSEAAGPAGSVAPTPGSLLTHGVLLDDAAGGALQPASVNGLSLEKTAEPGRVEPGGVATYTLTFSNSGTVARTLDTVFDMLPTVPATVTFKAMTAASDVQDDPFGSIGTIFWAGPLSIDPLAELTVQYQVTMPLVAGSETFVNNAWGQIDSTTVGPDSAEVKVGQTGMAFLPIALRDYVPPRFTVSKTAHPGTVFNIVPEAVFTYTVSFFNEGTVPGVLADIRDTLPAGFEYQRMVTDTSDVDSAPSGTTGEIVWPGPLTVTGQSTMTLVYRVTSDPITGAYTNSATATTVKGAPPETPGQATVYISEPIYLEEDWSTPSPYWAPFSNYNHYHPDLWFIAAQGGIGFSPALKHDYDRGGYPTEDALYTYLGPGSEDWTDYRYEAEIKRSGAGLIGLWFRGKVVESTSLGRHVEGYYLTFTTAGDWLRLSVLCDYGPWAYHFTCTDIVEEASYAFDPDEGWFTVAVEVQGQDIRVYVDDNLVMEAEDDTYPTGTVGMKTYRLREGLWDDIVVTPIY